MSAQKADLCVVFDAKSSSLKKDDQRATAQATLQEYNSILDVLHKAGLNAVGKEGDKKKGEILILVLAPWSKVADLVEREKHSDFLHGLPSSTVPSQARDFQNHPLSPADRVRLVHDYLTSTPSQGGLGIAPGNVQYPHIKSVFALHDRHFNSLWMNAWTTRQLGLSLSTQELDTIKNQFGESVALYYCFLASYTKALIFPAFLGIAFWRFGSAYHPAYSILVVIWSIFFVEWWRIAERKLAVRWGSRGVFRVEKRRVEFNAALRKKEAHDDDDDENVFPWWKREARVLTSLPVIALAAVGLTGLLTSIFLLEAFVLQLYNGPGKQFASLTPTILFSALIPQFLALYQRIAIKLTNWENHAHQSTHNASLTIKTFALSAIVAYLGLSLSAFVYVPFGEFIMTYVQVSLFSHASKPTSGTGHPAHEKAHEAADKVEGLAEEASKGVGKLNADRLQNQMFATLVTNQLINMFLEIGLPFIMKGVNDVKEGKGVKLPKVNGVNKDAPEDEQSFVEDVKEQAGLIEYSLFVDYSEMVTQFGHVALYSTIWPLAPVMAFLNNWIESRSDAFKMTQHTRRPIPTRSDTIGPWLENMSFISWLAALTNSALVFLFRPESRAGFFGIFHFLVQQPTSSFTSSDKIPTPPLPKNEITGGALRTLETSILPAILIALTASHAYFVAKVLIKHLLERAFWKGSPEARELDKKDRNIKEKYLTGLQSRADNTGGEKVARSLAAQDENLTSSSLWHEEGAAALQSLIKTD